MACIRSIRPAAAGRNMGRKTRVSSRASFVPSSTSVVYTSAHFAPFGTCTASLSHLRGVVALGSMHSPFRPFQVSTSPGSSLVFSILMEVSFAMLSYDEPWVHLRNPE